MPGRMRQLAHAHELAFGVGCASGRRPPLCRGSLNPTRSRAPLLFSWHSGLAGPAACCASRQPAALLLPCACHGHAPAHALLTLAAPCLCLMLPSPLHQLTSLHPAFSFLCLQTGTVQREREVPTELVHRGDVLKVHMDFYLLLSLVCLRGWQLPLQLRGAAPAIAATNRGAHVPFWGACCISFWGACCISFWGACSISFWGACCISFWRICHPLLGRISTRYSCSQSIDLNPSAPAGAAGGAHPNGWGGAGGHIVCG